MVRKWFVVFILSAIVLLLTPVPVLADTSAGITVTAVGWVGGDAPSGLTLTYVNDYEVGVSWVKGTAYKIEPPGTVSTVVNTLIRIRWGEIPASRTDGYQVYYGDGNSFSDTAADLTSLTSTPYYRAWSETVFYDAGGNIISSAWEATGTTEEANFMSISWLFMALLLAALGLTGFMFHTRNAILGFPSAIFWALFGGYSYSLSTATWDIHFMIAFTSLLGMVTFTALGAYSLREKRDTIADEEMEKGEDKFIDEGKQGKKSESWYDDDGIPDEATPSRRTSGAGRTRPRRKGEFEF